MKRVIGVFILVFGFGLNGFSQSRDSSINALKAYLVKHIRYPAVAFENEIKGQCYLSFKVNEDKTLSDVKVLKPLELGCSEEVERVLKSYHDRLLVKPNEYSISVSFNYAVQGTVVKSDPNFIKTARKQLKQYLFNVDYIKYHPPIKRFVTDSPGMMIKN